MPRIKSEPHPDKLATWDAKRADRAENAKVVWAEVDAQQRAREENTARLRAARLAQKLTS